jgi:hypothetical protein
MEKCMGGWVAGEEEALISNQKTTRFEAASRWTSALGDVGCGTFGHF